MFFVNELGQLQIRPSAVPLGSGSVIVAKDKKEATDVLYNVVIKWLVKSTAPAVTTVYGITWHLQEKTSAANKFVLSYSLNSSNIKVELFHYDSLAGVIYWLNQQFEPLTGKITL